jgi:hypothetical protein
MRRTVILVCAVATLTAGVSAAQQRGATQQQGITIAALRGYLDKMSLRYVSHPKNADALVVPRSENKNAERLDLYVELRKDQLLVLPFTRS